MKILGLSAFYHDSAAALVVDGEVVAAAQEERFSRHKHDAGFPAQAIRHCLQAAGLQMRDIDHVAFYDKPLLKFERLLETYLAFAPRGFKSFGQAIPVWLREKLFLGDLLGSELKKLGWEAHKESPLLYTEHHLSHAASAFYPSPFEEAAVLTLDGVGEWATTTLALGRGNDLKVLKEIHFPHSLGLLYAAFTYYCGFKVNSGEYKLMGLAPYGKPVYAALIREHLIDVKPDGSFRLDLRYFDYCTGLTMTNTCFDALFGAPPRAPESPLMQRHMDLAASIQQVTEEVVLRLARSVAAETGQKALCLAGGVALNCVANGKILRDGAFEQIWIQPAAGDAGGALGAALATHHLFKTQPRRPLPPDVADGMKGAQLGPEYSQDECEQRLRAAGAHFTVLEEPELLQRCAQALADGKAVGWFQGRMEFGPRALGNRSILGDPRSPSMQSALNLKIKYRESFRPFAPSVLKEHARDWFDLEADSPYMLLVGDVAAARLCATDGSAELQGLDLLKQSRSQIPAVTHVDNSARVQTVDARTNPRYHALLSRFEALTGCPILVNTSFNVRGEPLVCTPEDAFRCFMGTELDLLFVENCVMVREEQNPALRQRYDGDLTPD